MLGATGDPYTRFLDTEAHQKFNNQEGGQRVGVGVEVTMKGGYPIVIAPVPGSPARGFWYQGWRCNYPHRRCFHTSQRISENTGYDFR